ncbi:AAA family ATPase [Streptomyces sp. NPDC058947]|uniref:AAA family ATPase n=1 Tax=Streptomyces sp. NPDC058947 TaxID=3346675 RepID=UPI00368DA312
MTLRVVLMVGPAASGKSTYIRERFPGHLILNADRIRLELTGDAANQSRNGEVFRLLRKRLAEGLRKGRSVVVDNTNLLESSRGELYRVAEMFQARVEARVMATSLDECLRRNADRDRTVPEDVIRRQFGEYLTALSRLPRESALSEVEIVSD